MSKKGSGRMNNLSVYTSIFMEENSTCMGPFLDKNTDNNQTKIHITS